MAHKSGRRKREDPEPEAPPEDAGDVDGDGGNPAVREVLLEVVDNQLRANDPPETRATYDRLMRAGNSSGEAKRLIAIVLIVELNEMLRVERNFDEAGYVAALRALPTLPYDDDDE
jgi:vacuolar-type H+-ATPase subunit B/Vma2